MSLYSLDGEMVNLELGKGKEGREGHRKMRKRASCYELQGVGMVRAGVSLLG